LNTLLFVRKSSLFHVQPSSTASKQRSISSLAKKYTNIKILSPVLKNTSALKLVSRKYHPDDHAPTEKRQISPHVTIYKFPFNALTSITTRITGLMLTGVVYTSGLICLASFDSFPVLIDTLRETAGPLVKFLVAFPFSYHTAFGLRHLYWDYTAKNLELEDVKKSGYYLLGASTAATLLLTII